MGNSSLREGERLPEFKTLGNLTLASWLLSDAFPTRPSYIFLNSVEYLALGLFAVLALLSSGSYYLLDPLQLAATVIRALNYGLSRENNEF